MLIHLKKILQLRQHLMIQKSNDDETSKDTTSKDIDKADKNNTSNQDNNDKNLKL